MATITKKQLRAELKSAKRWDSVTGPIYTHGKKVLHKRMDGSFENGKRR
jgi:hypothetical protein